MIFKDVATVEIVEKVSKNGYVYQVVKITFDNGNTVPIHADAKEILCLIYGMNEK